MYICISVIYWKYIRKNTFLDVSGGTGYLYTWFKSLSGGISFKYSYLRILVLPISKTTHSIRYQKKIGRVSHLAGQFQFNTGFDLSNIQYLKVLNCLAVLHWCLDTAALKKSSQKTRDKMGHIRAQLCSVC